MLEPFERPEPEYLDGCVVERNSGSIPHSRALGRVLRLLSPIEGYAAYPLVTMQLTPTRRRVADVAVFSGDFPEGELYPSTPPVVAVEIVEEEDRWVAIQSRLAEYHGWGVKHVWLVDPWTRSLFTYDSAGFHQVPSFFFGVKLSAAELFAD